MGWYLPLLIIFLSLSALIAGAVAVYSWRRRRQQTEAALRRLNQELEQRVDARTRELENSLQKMKLAYEQATIYAKELAEEVAERKQAQAELKRSHRNLIALHAIATMISRSKNLNGMLTTTLDLVLAIVEPAGGYIQLVDFDSGEIRLAVHNGLEPKTIQAIKSIELSCPPAQAGPDLLMPAPVQEVIKQAGWHPLAGVPLKSREAVIGCIQLLSKTPRELEADERQLLEAIGHQVGIAVENERLTQETAKIQVMQEVDNLRSELIGNISHELRTPLGLIKAASTTLLADDIEFDRETQTLLLQGINDETERLEHIVGNLLDLSRLEQKRFVLERAPTDLGQLVPNTVETMRGRMKSGLEIVYDFPDDPLLATVDAKRIEQVVRNLITNALKYSPRGGTVTIKGWQDEQQVYIQVSDQGIGIPPEELERIFDRFYRVENEASRGIGGIGLGLAISREIINAHHGRLWATSEWGAGSTFYFCLPKEAEPDPVAW